MTDESAGDRETAASDAFGLLGNPTRMAIIEALVDGDGEATTKPFSELYAATEEDTTAGFAYHLRQLTGHYVRKVERDDATGYRLTDAGRRIARELAAGTYVDSVDRDPMAVEDDCPLCETGTLAAETVDNVVTVGCRDCGHDVLTLPFPPGGHRTHGEAFLAAFDRHHRHRIAVMTDGACPECGGAVDRSVEIVEPPAAETDADDVPPRAHARLDCTGCGYRLRVPPTLTVLDHPAVVALYHDHGVDLRERPIWNVGPEWRETVVARDPVVVRVSTTVDGDQLVVYLDAALSVVHVESPPDRAADSSQPVDDAGADESIADDGTAESAGRDTAEPVDG